MSLISALYAYFLAPLLTLLLFAIVIQAVLSWLIAFDVINTRNRFVWQISGFLKAVTDPVLRPLRRIIPPLGGVDISPIIAILAIVFVRDWALPALVYDVLNAPPVRRWL